MGIIHRMGKNAREYWNSPFFFDRLIASPYIFALFLRGQKINKTAQLIKSGKYSYYLTMYKCGSSTITKAITDKYKKTKIIRLGNKNKIKRLRKNNFLFTFVRNPYERILSSYLDKIKTQASDRRRGKFYNILENISNKDISFEEFVDFVSRTPDKLLDKHLRPYHLIVSENVGEVDFVGKLENFEEDWEFISKMIGFPPLKELKIKNKNKRDYNLDKYYNHKLKKKIYEKYEKDFKMFGYKR